MTKGFPTSELTKLINRRNAQQSRIKKSNETMSLKVEKQAWKTQFKTLLEILDNEVSDDDKARVISQVSAVPSKKAKINW